MSDPTLRHTLTAARLETLRLLATGGTRNRDGSLFQLHPTRLAWLIREGYVEEPAPRVRGKQLVVVVTAKGFAAVGGA